MQRELSGSIIPHVIAQHLLYDDNELTRFLQVPSVKARPTPAAATAAALIRRAAASVGAAVLALSLAAAAPASEDIGQKVFNSRCCEFAGPCVYASTGMCRDHHHMIFTPQLVTRNAAAVQSLIGMLYSQTAGGDDKAKAWRDRKFTVFSNAADLNLRPTRCMPPVRYHTALTCPHTLAYQCRATLEASTPPPTQPTGTKH